MSIQSIVNTHTYVHMKNEEYSYPRIRSGSASSVSMPGVACLSTTAVYTVGGKEKNKVFNPRKN